MQSQRRRPALAHLVAALGLAASLGSGQALADDEEHAPPPVEAGVVVATLPDGVELPAARVATPEASSEAPAAAGPRASNLLVGGAVPQGTEAASASSQSLAIPATPEPAAGTNPARAEAPPAGWTRVGEPARTSTPPGWTPVDQEPASPEGSTAPGWTPVGDEPGATAAPAEGWRSRDGTPGASVAAADRRLAVGGSLGGAGIASADVLVRLGPTWTFDAGLGLRNTFVEQETRGMILAGMSWQAGERRSRHGLYGRTGVVPDEQEGGEVLGSVGYAWRLLPRRGSLSFSLEAGPVWMAALAPEPGEPAAWLLPYVRVGMHAWFRDAGS